MCAQLMDKITITLHINKHINDLQQSPKTLLITFNKLNLQTYLSTEVY